MEISIVEMSLYQRKDSYHLKDSSLHSKTTLTDHAFLPLDVPKLASTAQEPRGPSPLFSLTWYMASLNHLAAS